MEWIEELPSTEITLNKTHDRANAPAKCLALHPTITKLNYFERRDLVARTNTNEIKASDHDGIQILTRGIGRKKTKKASRVREYPTPG